MTNSYNVWHSFISGGLMVSFEMSSKQLQRFALLYLWNLIQFLNVFTVDVAILRHADSLGVFRSLKKI